ncbi:hypothetical protein ACIQW9_02755 [Herminiimonas sp. NPDC097707]|uniref:hypothetical protein n=1 Tax=Herminiimonas sp. NPDC097707 TaxID=3364007 RepID=UPI00383B3A7E
MLYPTELWAETVCGGMKSNAVLLKERLTVCRKGAALCLFYREVSMLQTVRSMLRLDYVHRLGILSRAIIVSIKFNALKFFTG